MLETGFFFTYRNFLHEETQIIPLPFMRCRYKWAVRRVGLPGTRYDCCLSPCTLASSTLPEVYDASGSAQPSEAEREEQHVLRTTSSGFLYVVISYGGTGFFFSKIISCKKKPRLFLCLLSVADIHRQ